MQRKTPLKVKKPLQVKTALKSKTTIPKKPKKHSVAWYKKEARKYFNMAVKYRDSTYENNQWTFICITCQSRVLFKDADGKTYKNAQAGHYQPEIYSNTRFDEENVNGQCGMRCNKLGLGEQVKYAIALDKKYGKGTAQRLNKEAGIPKQWTIPELEEIIHRSKERINHYLLTNK